MTNLINAINETRNTLLTYGTVFNSEVFPIVDREIEISFSIHNDEIYYTNETRLFTVMLCNEYDLVNMESNDLVNRIYEIEYYATCNCTCCDECMEAVA